MNEEKIVLKRLKDTLVVLIEKNVITNLDFQIRNMVEDCIKVIEKQQAELEKKDKVINKMAEQLTTDIHSKEWVIDYYEREVEK